MKPRRKRRRFTHVEICRDGRRLFRVSVAEDVLHTCRDELGALIRKISPGASRPTASQAEAVPPPESDEVMMHLEHNPNDDLYHARARSALKDLVGSLCDPLLDDAIEMARSERERRIAGGGN